jgi:phytanoyl-CoA dioxygenase PhyH
VLTLAAAAVICIVGRMQSGSSHELLTRGDLGQRELDDVQRSILESLRRDGIAMVAFATLFDDERLWTELRDDMAEFIAATEANLSEPRRALKGKAYIVRRFLAKSGYPQFSVNDPWLRLGLSSRLLDVINGYRGEAVQLIDVDNWYTIPDPDADTRVKSQQWHRDPWDERIVKVFVYFSDVDESAGPFEYIPGSAPGGRYGELWPWQPEGVYPPQEELEAAIPTSEWLSATGPAGTVILCDTSGFHRGGWAKSKLRVLSVHTYVGQSSTKRPRFRLEGQVDDSALPPAARLALSWAIADS